MQSKTCWLTLTKKHEHLSSSRWGHICCSHNLLLDKFISIFWHNFRYLYSTILIQDYQITHHSPGWMQQWTFETPVTLQLIQNFEKAKLFKNPSQHGRLLPRDHHSCQDTINTVNDLSAQLQHWQIIPTLIYNSKFTKTLNGFLTWTSTPQQQQEDSKTAEEEKAAASNVRDNQSIQSEVRGFNWSCSLDSHKPRNKTEQIGGRKLHPSNSQKIRRKSIQQKQN